MCIERVPYLSSIEERTFLAVFSPPLHLYLLLLKKTGIGHVANS
jgi:hypothetical protein